MYQDNRLNLASVLLVCAITLTLRIDILSLSGTEAAQFTFQNNCKYTVWPGLLPNGGWPLLAQGGFELLAGQSTIVDAPIGWSGRFWGRTGCSFSNTPSLGGAACETGDCGSKVECNGAGATPPATLAEFTLAGVQAGAKDFYDVSLVDGYNIPIAILPSPRKSNSTDTALSQQFINAAASEDHYVCTIAGCVADLNLNCPKDLQMYSTSSIHLSDSNVIGCRSACDAFQSPQYCCTGIYANPNTCQATSYSEIFKQACPGAYSYAYDDHTSTFTCKGSDYSIIFCPSSLSQLKDLGNSQNGSGSKEVSCCFLRTSLSILLLATLAAFTVY